MPRTAADSSLELLLRTAHDALWLWEPASGRMTWGRAWQQITGLDSSTPLHPGLAEWQDRLHPDERDGVLAALAAHLRGDTSQFESEHRLRHEDGSYRWVAVSALCRRNAAGEVLSLAGAFTDITERKALDPYTRLPNRILFLDRLERSLSRLRFGGQHAVGVLALRLQLAAGEADQLSHDQQAELGRTLCERITAELRPWDFVAQFDALEFAVLLDMVAAGSDLPTITDRLFKTLHQPVNCGPHPLQLTVAIGSADSATVSGDETRLLRAAETAAQLAATQGDACHVRFDPATQDLLNFRLEQEQELVAAVLEQRFEPWFQPIVRLSDGVVLGFEALARWPHEGQWLEPPQFLPFLERSGLINQLTWISLEKGLRALASWQQQGRLAPECRLSINLPAEQLLEPQFARQVLTVCTELGMAPQRLRLELPEKAVTRHNPAAWHSVEQLHAAGVEIALDDLGHGLSALLPLQRFPLDALKIDRPFVHCLDSDPAACGMSRTVIALAAALNLPAVAKGVETASQQRFLQDNGVSAAQGFRYARPMPAAAVPAWLDDWVRQQSTLLALADAE